MSFWSEVFLNNANSPIIEQLIFFHDHSIIIIVSIIICISYFISLSIINKYIYIHLNENHIIETIWTLIPALLLFFIAIPRLNLLYIIEESYSTTLSIKILGHQWYWSYELRDFNKEFDSFISPLNYSSQFRNLDVDNNIIIPFNTSIKLFISAADVIHAWTIPSLGIKIDAIPGRLNQIIFYSLHPGVFFGQCSEICGANHRFIPICIEITNISNFINFVKLL